MNSITEGNQKTGGSGVVMWTIMGIGIVAVAGLLIWLLTSPSQQRQQLPQLQGALREGAQFEELKKKIVVEREVDYTTETKNIAGNLQVNIAGMVRNFTGKTITGLEVVGSVVNKDGIVVREKAAVVVPVLQEQIAPNKTLPIRVSVDGFEEKDDRADIRWRISAIKVE
jgi:hypothetical protein